MNNRFSLSSILPVLVASLTLPLSGGLIEVDFDTAANWTSGSGGFGSYQSDHVYEDFGVVFSGGPAIRQTASDVDGVPGALGTHAWRLRDGATVAWTATLTDALDALTAVTGFGFDARRWDGNPSPAYTVDYSLDGGLTFTTATEIGTAGVLDNDAFGSSSAWSTFSQTISSPFGLDADLFVVRLAATSGERVMIDNFRLTTSTLAVIPEPALAWPVVVSVVGLLVRRRRRR
jgi:hypothetical protein